MCPFKKITNEEVFLLIWNFEVDGPERVEKTVTWKNHGKQLDFVVNFLPYITTVRYTEERTSFKARVRLEPVHLNNKAVHNAAFKASWIKVNQVEKVKMGNHLDALESDVFELSLVRESEAPSKITIQAWVEVACLTLPLTHPLHKYLSPLSYGYGLPSSRRNHHKEDKKKVTTSRGGEKLNSRLHLITISKLNRETLKKFGNYVDTGKHFEPVGATDAQHLYDAASQCSLNELRCYCIKYLKENMGPENVISILIFANLRSETELQEAALNLITKCGSVCRLPNWHLLMQNRTDLALLITRRLATKFRVSAGF